MQPPDHAQAIYIYKNRVCVYKKTIRKQHHSKGVNKKQSIAADMPRPDAVRFESTKLQYFEKTTITSPPLFLCFST